MVKTFFTITRKKDSRLIGAVTLDLPDGLTEIIVQEILGYYKGAEVKREQLHGELGDSISYSIKVEGND